MRGAIRLLAVISVASSFVAPSSAIPTVSWSSSAVSITLLTGTLSSSHITFVSTQNLENIDVTIVPALKPYVSVFPSHYAQLVGGLSYEVRILFSIPATTLPGMYSGTIKLSSNTKPPGVFAVPLSVSITVQQPTSTFIPPDIALPSLDRVVGVTSSGPFYASNELLISVIPGTTDAQVEGLAAAEKALFLGQDRPSHTYQLLIPFSDLHEAITLIQLLHTYKFVGYAIPAFFSQSQVTFPNDASWNLDVRFTRSWGQETIHLPSAWDLTQGDTNVTLAVIDGGFDLNHEDLKPAAESSTPGFDPTHGTEVASLAAATGDNIVGLAGAMWKSHLILLGSDYQDIYFDLHARHNMYVAIAQGARIINYSYARNWSSRCNPTMSEADRLSLVASETQFWQQVVQFAPNVLFVFAAGNDHDLVDSVFPATLGTQDANVNTVAGTDLLSNEASYSNYGRVSIWAPGGDQSTRLCDGSSSSPVSTAHIWVAQPHNSYGFVSGTSYSAPFVSGVAGLMLSKNSSLTAPEIKNFIDATADPTGQLDPSGNDIRVLNAFHAIQQAIANPEFDFALDSLLVVGNVNGGAGFFDDFNDGSLTVPPTSNINCNLNTAPVSESGGFLHLSSADGANTFTPGALVDNCFLGLDATGYRFNKGSGGATITASFRADAPLPAQAYGLQLFTVGTDELVSTFVTNNGAGPVVGALTKTATDVVTVENVPLNLTGAQRVFLRLTYNDSTNQVAQSFSTDGSTFTTVSVPQPGTVMTTGTQALTSVFGSVQLATSP